jgi:hypothetical protein
MHEAGEQLGRYLIRSSIGACGMEEVFLAEDSEGNYEMNLLVEHSDFYTPAY